MYYDLYIYETSIPLLYDQGRISSCTLDNRPMDSKIIKLHKGVDQKVGFKVYDPDRKLTGIEHLRVQAALVNPINGERMFTTYCKISNKKGAMELEVKETDLMDVPAGFYNLVLNGQEWSIPETEGYITATPFYTDANSNIRLSVEVSDLVDMTPVPTITIEPKNWILQTDANLLQPEYVSQAYPANRLKNSKNGSHTIAIYMTNFTGDFQVYGTLDSIPSQDLTDYFPVNLTNMNDMVTFEYYTGIDAYHFEANIMWLKFRYKHNQALSEEERGTVDLVHLRS